MKLELNKAELNKAVELYIQSKGINIDYSKVEVNVGKYLTTVKITEYEPREQKLEEINTPSFFEEEGSTL